MNIKITYRYITIINTHIEYPHGRDTALNFGMNKYHGHPCVVCGNTLRRVKQYDCYSCHQVSRKKHIKTYSKTPKGREFKKHHRLLYKARLVTQCPPWADRKAIAEVYRKASKLGLEVDHVVPLKGISVCGLHVENNLQIITAEENSAKRNHFDDWSNVL